MRFTVKNMDIRVGDTYVVMLNEHDASCLGAHAMDRLRIENGRRSIVAALDIANTAVSLPSGSIGLFDEVAKILNVNSGTSVRVHVEPKPESLSAVKKKLDGKRLNYQELYGIVKDIVENRLTTVEVSAFVLGNYTRGLSEREVLDLTKAMIATGDRVKLPGIVADLHSIGGVPGNRTTPIVVAIVSSTGLLFPKTSSRAITSPAGTADTMEVICKVDLSLAQLQACLRKAGAFLAWGGAVQMAPADDKIIRVESPLHIDAEGQMLASIMAKKASAGATHLLMEIPFGQGAKASRKQALHLKKRFEHIGAHLGIAVEVLLTRGEQPIGNGIGPVLEMRDILSVLRNEASAPADLKEHSLYLAGALFELTGTKKGEGRALAQKILVGGQAMKQFERIVKAQQGRIPKRLILSKNSRSIRAARSGKIIRIDNKMISQVARIAGSPVDKQAGMFLHIHVGNQVRKGDKLVTIYSPSKDKLAYALRAWHEGVVVR